MFFSYEMLEKLTATTAVALNSIFNTKTVLNWKSIRRNWQFKSYKHKLDRYNYPYQSHGVDFQILLNRIFVGYLETEISSRLIGNEHWTSWVFSLQLHTHTQTRSRMRFVPLPLTPNWHWKKLRQIAVSHCFRQAAPKSESDAVSLLISIVNLSTTTASLFISNQEKKIADHWMKTCVWCGNEHEKILNFHQSYFGFDRLDSLIMVRIIT